jgi:hypothetical protein
MLVIQGYENAMQNQITMKAAGPSAAAIATIAAAPANERKVEYVEIEAWRYMKASLPS